MARSIPDLGPLAALLPPWYAANARVLPWRADTQPYHVWVSEIMLQQTRVEAVTGYYRRFLEALPTVEALAEADDELLLKLWEGLGYYSRARNLKKAARKVVNELDGVFPQTCEELKKLPGIGPYTAGAIASICFEQPAPAVDGNVLRVFARYTAYPAPADTDAAKKDAAGALRPLYVPGKCGVLTQSLMELGACVCVPNGAPACEKCPLRESCRAHAEDAWSRYPVKSEKKARRTEERIVLVLRHGDRFAVKKRPPRGLLAGLWEFPNAVLKDPENALGEAVAFAEALGAAPKEPERQTAYTHIFTHMEWHARVFCFACANAPEELTWATAEELRGTYAVPSAFRPALALALSAER